MDSDDDFDALAEKQAWNEYTLLAILRSFISQAGLQDDLNRFAKEWADTENSASA